MLRLARIVHSRDNNFTLLRLLAACAVLLSHAFPLATGDRASEPLRAALGCTPGSIAVDLFFLISGMLVTASLLRRDSARDFVRARFLRIWPALTVVVLLMVFALGPAFTTLPLGRYFAERETWRSLGKNLVLLRGIGYTLPGVFASNPSPGAVNGSLWTLPNEVKCYLVLLAGWWILRQLRAVRHLGRVVALLWIALLAWHLRAIWHGTLEDSAPRLPWMFCTGAALYLFRERVRLSAAAGAVAFAALLASALVSPRAFPFVYSLTLPYLTLCAAYLPRGRILAFNRFGDYSYGTYIFAYPVQQSLMALFPSLGVGGLFAGSLVVTLALAVASWRFIEEPAIGLAHRRRAPTAPGGGADLQRS
jgi:peptidoglycan/LPS O-acetylase OafA/YrhL